MEQFNANAARSDNSNALRFMTGNTPGIPKQTGHTCELGDDPNLVLHPQKSFVLVSNCT